MTHTASLDHLMLALKLANHPQEQRQGAEAVPVSASAADVTIALEREPGTPATEVAQEIGAQLDWPVYDHKLLDRIAQELGLPVLLVEQADERRQNWLLECLEGIGKGTWVSESTFVWQLRKTIGALASKGRCVIVGRGAAQFLSHQSTLRVRLVGEKADRVAALARQLRLNREEAARQAEAIFQERTRFIKHHFHKDPTLPENYDLVLNTSHLPPVRCADLVLQALHQFREASEEAILDSTSGHFRGYWTSER
jgi:cytidylate kinase